MMWVSSRGAVQLVRWTARRVCFLRTANAAWVGGCAAGSARHSLATAASSSNVDDELNAFINSYVSGRIQPSIAAATQIEHIEPAPHSVEDELAPYSIEDTIRKAKTVDFLKATCLKLSRPFTSGSAAAILGQFSSLSFECGAQKETSNWLESHLLNDLQLALSNDVSAADALTALTALYSLGSRFSSLESSLLGTLRAHLSTDMLGVPLSPIVKLIAIARTNKVQLPNDVQMSLHEAIRLRTSEVDHPADAISLLINVHISDAWVSSLLERTVEMLSLMSLGELVSVLAILANSKNRNPGFLQRLAGAIDKNPSLMTVNQMASLAQSMRSLSFTDARLLRRLASDIVVNIDRMEKWPAFSTIVVSLSRIRLSDRKMWHALSTWMNDNYKEALLRDLSYAVVAFAFCDECSMLASPARHLISKLDARQASALSVWLNVVHALAISRVLTKKLAETVLDADFVEKCAKESPGHHLLNLSRIAQIQAYVECELPGPYTGPVMRLQDWLPPSQALNDKALLQRSGLKGAYAAECFHEVLYKLAPLDSHATRPALHADGFFVDAIVMLDENRRFVEVKNFAACRMPQIAIVYLGLGQMTITCKDDEESHPLGAVALGLRLLKARGLIPVTFTERELLGARQLVQKIELIRDKLYRAVDSAKQT